MNITHLKYAIEVLKTKSITKASQNLYMGQPNLSKALKDFEKEIGFTLFKRNVKGVEPTQKGLEFLISAQNILNQLNLLEKNYKSADDSCEVNISVVRCANISKAFTDYLNLYKEKNNIKIKFRETSAQNVISDVISSQADFGIIRYQNQYEKHFISEIQNSKLKYKFLGEFKLCLLMHNSHPLANKDIILNKELENYIEITQGDYYINKTNHNKLYKNKRISVYDRASQYDILREVKGTYMWVCDLPFDVLHRNDLTIKRCNDVENNISKDIFIYKQNLENSKKANDFLKCLDNIY